MPQPAARLNNLPPYPFAISGQRIQQMNAQGLDVISLDIGSPDMPPPQKVIDALTQSAENAHHHGYTGYRGTIGFRQAVAHYYRKRFEVELDPESEVLPLIGSKEGIINLSLAYLDRGDFALVPDIGYPSYSMGAYLAGGGVQWMPIHAKNQYLPNFSAITPDQLSNTKLLWVNYPNNPTGAVAPMSFYQQAVSFCREHDLVLASDNPYVDVTYDNFRASSVLEADDARDCAVEFMSLSKTFNMGGWRLGAAVGNAKIIKTLLQAKSNVDSGHFRPVYDAGIAALQETSDEWMSARNAIYARRRDQIIALLPEIGLQAETPKGSLYIWARTANNDGNSYTEAALTEARVAFAPGSMYGPGGKPYVRISLGISDERLDEALERLKIWYTNR